LQKDGATAATRKCQIAVDPRLVEFRLREPGMGEIRLLRVKGEFDNSQAAILLHPRNDTATAPIGRAAVTELDGLTGVIDPDGRLRPFTKAKVQNRLLIAPLVPAVMD